MNLRLEKLNIPFWAMTLLLPEMINLMSTEDRMPSLDESVDTI